MSSYEFVVNLNLITHFYLKCKILLGIHAIIAHRRARGLVGYDVALTQRRS
ncbi:hypothetical protein MNV_560029 [Candidatus Methanoperedens nitroreducens]|uniref:Uncharacterized protein n=1 Tax=Candidatus Methanoperedens nitratireducens TaxID=1392998 RepID=A0A284VS15_9EURY|nr:hypothetical protein MNV_560029 [Candidatus Methanoperedens nitroreducens]